MVSVRAVGRDSRMLRERGGCEPDLQAAAWGLVSTAGPTGLVFIAGCVLSLRQPVPGHRGPAWFPGTPHASRVAYLKGSCHMSFSAMRKFVRDAMQGPISGGLLAKKQVLN